MGRTRKTRKTRKAPVESWGYHLLINAGDCDHDAIRSKPHIAAFVKELVKTIDMVAFGPPRIVRFGSGTKMGYTLVQLIETSDITCHFSEETGAVYFDCFSCKPFNTAIAKGVFVKYFKPKRMNCRFFKRQG